MTNELKEALSKLNPENDDHWTTDGLPRLDLLKALLNGRAVTRADINACVKGFSRKNNSVEAPSVVQPTNLVEEVLNEDKEEEEEADTEEEAALEGNDSKAVERELIAAREAFNKAQQRFTAAKLAMDVVIRAAEKTEQRDLSHDIKAYQAAQAKRRQEIVERQAALFSKMPPKSNY